jgi:opacity protein-like surface antigen
MKRFLLGVAVVVIALSSMQPALGADEGSVPSWVQKVKFSGDLRYRYEYIDKDESVVRKRQRIRARVSMDAQVADEWKVGLRFASGSSDPVSTNQTIGDSFSTKDFRLDKAYVEYAPAAVKGLKVIAGKMSKPWVTPGKTDLVWDGDLNPEGIAAKYSTDVDGFEIFGSTGVFQLEERKSTDDAVLFTGQAGVETKLADNLTVIGGASYIDYLKVQDMEPLADAEDGFGNTTYEEDPLDPDNETILYSYDYNLVEGFVEIQTKLGDLPVSVHGDYVVNTDVSECDTGWLAGVSLGKASAPGTWQLAYNYRDLEADAALGAFVDSDSGGGGTDIKGHKVSAKIALQKNVSAGATYFMSEIGDKETDYDRLQLDLAVKF